MGNLVTISDKLVTLMQTVQQDGSAAFADVKDFPTLQMEGWPAVTIVPSDSVSDYESIRENLRTYVFDIDIYYAISQETNGGYDKAFKVMRVLVDTVMDALDNCNSLDDAVDIIRPVPSVWGMVQTSAGSALNAKINLQCAVLVSQNNG